MSNIYEDYSELLIRYDDLFDVAEKYKKQLDIAVEALEQYTTFCRHPAEEALEQIKELDK